MDTTKEQPIDVAERMLRETNHNRDINIVPFRISGNRTRYTATDGKGFWYPLDHRFTPAGLMVRPTQ